MMEGLSVVLQFTAQVAHPVDVDLSVARVESTRIVQLAEGLAFDKFVQDLVHRDLSLELLVARTHSVNAIMRDGGLVVAIAQSLLNSSQVLEGTAG